MTITEARDEIFALLRNEWIAHASALPIFWQGETHINPPDQSQGYARATVLHSTGGQSSLGGTNGVRFSRQGVAIIQCFGPLGIGKSLTISEEIASMALDAFEGKTTPGGIWFRNCRFNEIGPADGWFQINVIAEFIYDEVK
jgi:hypothetical protein